ncbi:MAG: carboxypeptidase-like regulatory domain-containing protein [Sedimentisphaerales bacterium]|jgi:protocatechuate 3,4-dioxygenase beta subunit|nr:carboxypeptidase-like regulatory domain-containing protein [Sedimentisphaerales bacterium]
MRRIDRIEVQLAQFRVTTTITLDQRILDEAGATLEQATSGRSQATGSWYEGDVGRVVRIAAGLAVAAVVMFVAFVLWTPTGTDQPRTASEPGPNTPGGVSTPARRLAKERSEIQTMTAARNIGGLVTMLETGLPASQRLAAGSLGQIGDARALPALSRLAEKWQGDPDDNPFAQAIDQISGRSEESEPNEPDVPDANEAPVSQIVPRTQAAAVPVLSGTITDIDTGQPLEGVRVRLNGQGVYETTTDSNGLYVFDTVEKEGPCIIDLIAPEHVTLANWEREGTLQRVELRRGRPVVKDFALAKGAAILATIVNGAGQPVRRADLYAAYVSDEFGKGPKEFVASGDDGIVLLGGLRCDEYWVTVHHPDYAPAGRSVVLEKPGQVEPVEFVLAKGVDVVGVATCSDGLPPVGWRIEAKPKWWHCINLSYHGPREECVGEDGTFFLHHIVPGAYELELHVLKERGGWGRSLMDVNLPPETGLLDVQIPVPSARGRVSISGTVVFTGGHYGGRVRIDAHSATGGVGSAHLDAGQTDFTLTDLIPGLYDLSVWGGGIKRFKNIEAPSEGVVLEMPIGHQGDMMGWAAPAEKRPSLVLSGIVVDEAGRPVEGAAISDCYTQAKTAEAKRLATTDAEGCFTIGDVPGGETERWFVFRHPEYARTLRCIEMAAEGVTEARIILEKGGAVEGIVYDWQGSPLPEADVYLMDEKSFSYWAQNRARLGKVTTDAFGYYRIEHLPDELCYVFRGDPATELGVVLTSILPRAGQTVRLDIGGPWKTTGRLVCRGEPVANTKLLVMVQAGLSQGFEAYALSDSLGRFSFYGLPTGRRALYWAVPGRGGAQRWFALTNVDFQRGVDVDLGDLEAVEAEATVELLFADETMPIDRWDVTLRESDESFLSRQVGQLRPRREHSEPFVFDALSAGRYDVVASREGYPAIRDRLEIAQGQSHAEIVVTIPSGNGRISGEVVSWSDSEPWPLTVQSADGRIEMSVTPDADGTFEIAHLPEGEYSFSHSRLDPPLARVKLAAGGHETVRIEANPVDEHGYLRVLIVTDEGQPLATPDVWLERGGLVVEPVYNNDDATTFAAAPGTYTLCVHYPGFRSVRRRVELRTREGRTTQEVLEPLVITMPRE